MITIEDTIIKVEKKVEEVEKKIEEVEKKIEEAEQQIAAVEQKLEGELSADDKIYFREKEKQLREDKKQLREDKKQLREEKNILLARQQPQQDVGRSQPQSENGIPDHFAPILLGLAVRQMEVGWEKISRNRTSVESTTARTNSITFYGLAGRHDCQVLGPGTKHVKNAHIWPHNNMDNLPLIDLAARDIDKPKNVLRLHCDIEHKFDRFLLTFVPSGDGFVLEVLDPSIKNITLKDTTVTFENIDGLPLLFPSGNRPWRRILGTHSIFAHRKAREKGWLDADQLTAAEVSAQESMNFSLDKEAQARLRMVLPPRSS